MTIPQSNHWQMMGRRTTAMPRHEWPNGHLANVLVGPYVPQYNAMLERSKKAPEYEWRVDEHGIWVPFTWLR